MWIVWESSLTTRSSLLCDWNPQLLTLYTRNQPFSQPGYTIELCCEILSVWCICNATYVFGVNLDFEVCWRSRNSWLSGCGFESCCSHLSFRYRAYSEWGISWRSRKFRVKNPPIQVFNMRKTHSEIDLIETKSSKHKVLKTQLTHFASFANFLIKCSSTNCCEFRSCCCKLTCRYCACPYQWVLWSSGSFEVRWQNHSYCTKNEVFH